MIDKNLSSEELEQLEKEADARLEALESQLAFIKMLWTQADQDIIEIQAEKEILLRQLARLKKSEKERSGKYNGKDLGEKWKMIAKKMSDATTFRWNLFRSTSDSTVLTDEVKQAITEIFSEIIKSYNVLSKYNFEYKALLEKLQNSSDENTKTKLQEEIEDKVSQFNEQEELFNKSYFDFIHFEPTKDFYDEYAQVEVEKNLKTLNIDLDKLEPPKLANGRENVDRAKLMIYIDDYIRAYKEGRDIPASHFIKLEKYFDKNTDNVLNENFPAFFKDLTGIDFAVFDQENEVKNDKVRQMLTKHHIKSLNEKERLALKIELTEEDLSKEEEKRPILTYLSVTEKEEDEKSEGIVGGLKKRTKKLVTDLDYGTDPYLNRNPLYQKRAREVHETLYGTILEKGQIRKGLSDLTKITEVESLRNDIPGALKDHVRQKISETKDSIKQKVKDKVESKVLGENINSKGLRITTTIVDKARVLKRKKRKANKLGKTLTRFIIKRIFDELVGKVVDVARDAIKFVKNTTAISRMSNYINGSSFGQSLQKFGTAAVEGTKNVARMPGEFVRGLIDKSDLAIKAIKANRFVVAAMDVGHIAKTFVSKAPMGLVYGAGVGSIALSLGASSAALLPVAVGGGLLGMGLDTIDDLMHSPMYRPTSGFLKWIQSQGSALYRNPITGGFSNEIIQNNPELAERLGKVGNAFGTRSARLFSAAKSGFSAAMIAATIAGFLGINPVVAGLATFGVVTAGKFALRTATGQSIANRLLSSTYGNVLSRLAILPLQRMMFMITGTQVMSTIIEDLVDTMKTERTLSDLYKDKFSFKDKSVVDRFLTVNNYLGIYGYFSNYAFLSRFALGRMMEYILKGGQMEGLIGPSQYTGIIQMIKTGWGGLKASTSLLQVISKLGLALKAAFLPTLLLAGSSLLGIGIASLLGIGVSGIGATIGGVVGGLLGMGIGALLAGGSAGLLLPLVLVFNTIGTAIGTWIGSLFDNAISGAVKNVFAIIGGISFIFSLIDIFNNKSLNLRRLTMASMSLALTIPTLGAVLDKASTQQVQSNSTLPTPTVVDAYYRQDGKNSKIQVINNSGFPIKTSELNKLTNQIFANTPQFVDMEKFIILIKEGDSTIYINGNSLIISLSVLEEDPTLVIDELIAKISNEIDQKTSSR